MQEAENTRTEDGNGHVEERREHKGRLGPASSLEIVEEGDEEGKEWAYGGSAGHALEHVASHSLKTVCASTFMIRSTSNESYRGSHRSASEMEAEFTVVVGPDMSSVPSADQCLLDVG